VGVTTLAVLLSSAMAPLIACSGGGSEQGNAITIGSFAQPDLDPAIGFNIPSGAPLSQVYLPPLTYRRVEGRRGTELIPGLAEKRPHISNDGKTYTLRLRKGLVYSNGRPVKASDFEHAIKRLLNLGSPGVFLFDRIVGAVDYMKRGEPEGDITGIQTDDRTGRITIRLERPYAAFENVLALPFAAPVPPNTPFDNMTKDPPPGTGPFEITKSESQREYVLERNPKFDSLGIRGVPPAKLDRITVKIITEKAKQAEDILDNELDYMIDSPPPDMLSTVLERAGNRYEKHNTLNTNWFFLNGRVPPFDNPRVREAVAYAVDRRVIERIYVRDLRIGCSFLPPEMPGYNKTIDASGCPLGDARRPPDLDRAQRLIRAAGAEGADVTVWGFKQVPQIDVVLADTEMLKRIGLDAKPRIVDFAVWRQAIGNEKTKAQTGIEGLSPPQTFPHPLSFFTLVDGDSIQPTNSKNTSNVDDPHINRELDRLEPRRDLERVISDWEALDRYLVEKHYLIPFGHRVRGTFVSDRIDFKNCTEFHQIYLEDWSKFCLKNGEG
jgi:peptide/nickel transport system substrate-binding protein